MTIEPDELKKRIIAELKKVHPEAFVDHSMNPRNVGFLTDADASCHVDGSCGDAMEIWIKVKSGKITDTAFLTNGCGSTIACGSMLTEMAKGKTLGAALHISAKDIADALGGLPEENVHCAGLAESTLKKAIVSYIIRYGNQPWKKLYDKQSD